MSAVARATGIARSTINRGLKDLVASDRAAEGSSLRAADALRSRRPIRRCLEDLRGLLEPTTLGDPMRPLCGSPRAMRNSR